MASRETFYDTTEVLTDKQGNFYIPKKWSWNPWTNLVLDSSLIILKAGYGYAQTYWTPIIEANWILQNLSSEERGKPGAGCGRAVGDVKYILQCLSSEERERYERISYFDIRLKDGLPVFLLRKPRSAGKGPALDWGEVPEDKRKLLMEEINKALRQR
jgi:hypothetical protein